MLQPQRLRDFSGGLNLRDAPFVGDRDCLALENMVPLIGGSAEGRGGQTEYNAAQIDSNAIKSLYRFYKQNGSAFQLATSGTSVYKGNDGPGTFTAIDSGYTAAQRFGFTSWSAKDKVYFSNAVEPMKSFDGTTVATVGGSPPIGIGPELYNDRLWVLGNNLANFSDLNTDNVWNPAAALNVADNRGGTRAFIKAANGILIIGKTTGLFRFEGSPLLGGELRQYSNIGCVAPATARTITEQSGGQINVTGVVFLGPNGVYMTDGYTVVRISPKLDPVFTANFINAVGGYYPKKQQYWLSFDPAGGQNATTYVATKIEGPNGPGIAWSFYSGFKIDSFAVWDGTGDAGQFYSGRSDGGKVRRLDTGAQDVGVNYTAKLTSKNLDFGDSGINKSVRWLKTTFAAQSQPVGYIISYLSSDFAGNLEVSGSPGGQWDVGQWDVATWAKLATTNVRTSTLFSGYGRYINVTLQNTGDGADFRIDEILLEARVKERRTYDLFSLYQGG